ncbi:MAG: sugar porter family MFS transporter [Saprospiraceae bacterium]|nr:sugar porter family MFS transporter [Saprospiraceae bacterium]
MAKAISYNLRYLLLLSLISAMGGLLFGYDWVVIGGAKPFYEEYFHLTTPFQIGWAMSNALVGCLIGAALSGFVTDKFGRKKVLIAAGFLFTISALGTALADSFNIFVIARIIGGVGIGMASNVSPMYIAEIAPTRYRGRLVSLNQLTIVIGILAAQITNWLIAQPVPEGAGSVEILNSWNGQMGWRWMFGAEVVPAVAFFVLAFVVPESPRWLIKMRQLNPARQTLTKIGGAVHAEEELQNIERSLDEERGQAGLKELLSPDIRPLLLLGIGLAIFQQWCGINVIFNYAEEIFTNAGYSVDDMFFNIVITGTVNLIFTLVAMLTVDKWGRRKLMLLGSGGLFVIYIFVAFFYYYQMQGIHLLALVVSAIGVYAMSLAPVTWVIIAELFPNRIRGAAVSASVFALWLACLSLTYLYPLISEMLGGGAQGTALTFGLFAIICLVGFVMIRRKLPETGGKSLEELESFLMKNG